MASAITAKPGQPDMSAHLNIDRPLSPLTRQMLVATVEAILALLAADAARTVQPDQPAISENTDKRTGND